MHCVTGGYLREITNMIQNFFFCTWMWVIWAFAFLVGIMFSIEQQQQQQKGLLHFRLYFGSVCFSESHSVIESPLVTARTSE